MNLSHPMPGLLARATRALAVALALSVALLGFFPAAGLRAATITKAATGADLTAGASWGGGVEPGSGDAAFWTSTSLGAGLTLGSAKAWAGVGVTGATGAIGITGAGNLTLGPGGINMTASPVNMSLGIPVTLGVSQTWTVNTGMTLSATGVISGASMVLTKAGQGTLVIGNAANTFSGGTILNAGQITMDLQANAALGTGPVTLNAGTLLLNRVSAGNALIVNGGRLFPENGFGDAWNGPITLNANLTIDSPNYATFYLNGVVSGPGGLTLNGQGPVFLTVANSYTGPTSVSACTLQCNNKDSLGSGALSIGSAANSKVNLNYTGTKNIPSLTLGGVPQSGGSYGSTASPAATKNDTYFSGTGTVTIPPSSAKNIVTFSFGPLGAAAVNDPAIAIDVPIGTDRSMLAPTYTMSPGASGSPASGAVRDFTTPQTYTITAGDGSTKAYTVTVTEAVLPDIFTWANAASGNWNLAANWTNEALPVIVVAPQAGGRSTYTMNFSQAGTYTYTHNLNVGFVLNRLNFSGGAAIIVGTSSIALTSNAAILPQINQNATNNINIGAPLILANNVTLGGTGSGTVTISAAISGPGSLTKNNPGPLALSTASTYSGGTIINTSSVTFNTTVNTLLGTGPVTVNTPAILNLNGNNNIANSFTLNAATLVNGNSFSANLTGPVNLATTSIFDLQTTGNMSLSGVVSGPGGLVKRGSAGGPLSLTGANTFTGPVTVQAGSVSVASFNSVSGGTANSNLGAPTSVANGTLSLGSTTTAASLIYTGSGETTDRVIKLAGTTGGGTIVNSGTNTGLPTARGESGLLKFTSDVSIPGTAAADNRKVLTLTEVNTTATGANPGRGELSGSIGDSLLGTAGQLATSVTKAGVGIWTLSGANTYTGTTRVQAGILAFTRSYSLGGGPLNITTGAKAQLDYPGTRQVASLTFDAGATRPNGSYGSSISPATNKDDVHFSGPGTVTVGPVAAVPTLTRTVGTESANGGTSLTFTASGDALFYDGVTLIGSGMTLTTNALSSGVHAITAVVAGAASAPLTQTIVETRTTATVTTLTGSGSPSNLRAAVTFTATVTGGSPTGSVAFYNGGSPLGVMPLNGSRQAALTISTLPAGWNAITARYLGDAVHQPSTTASAVFQIVNPRTGNGRLKVFILSGQSNMQGKGRVETGRDPNNAANIGFAGGLGSLRNMLNKNPAKYGYLADAARPIAGGLPGWLKRGDVWVSAAGEALRKGDLDADFGDLGGQGRVGPEYGFGLVAGSQLGDQVLLIKVSWGGKSLNVDFRPPSSGGTVGPYYTLLINRVHFVLDNLATEFPAYNGAGYDLAGFAWHQGWNDLGQATAAYEANLVNLIKDIRAEFNAPNLPVSIGNTGMANGSAGTVLTAQLNVGNPALHPEFAGTVSTVDTRPYDFGEALGGSSEGYHWNWNAESYFNIGESMGQAMMALLPLSVTTTPFNAWAGTPAQGLTANVNDGPLDDPDQDGLENLLEFALGGSPAAPSLDNRPRLTRSGNTWTFEYDRADRSLGSVQTLEYGETLTGWTQLVIPVTSAGAVTVTPGSPSDHISVTLPAPGGKFFYRLKVSN